ncbi:MAG: amidohydrolase family protein [Albidovulum sp.]|nr:amidohydrolase family protein [Albidovulum sp.]
MIDAHHHIWFQKDLPWLLGPEQHRIFGRYGSIKRDYLIGEFLDDLEGTGIEKSVYVQANWAPNWFEDEVAWVQSVADESGWPHAISGYADFTIGDVRPQLDRLAAYPLMRAIRQQFHWHENPLYRFAQRPDLPADGRVQKNIAKLADYEWAFELQVFPAQMDAAERLANACPDVTFVLQHAGMLVDTTPSGWSEWRRGMKKLALCENVVSKLSGFGTFIRRLDPQLNGTLVNETLKIFGAERCMFGSNFPIEKIWTDYGSLLESHLAAVSKLPETDRHEIFSGTASRVYGI